MAVCQAKMAAKSNAVSNGAAAATTASAHTNSPVLKITREVFLDLRQQKCWVIPRRSPLLVNFRSAKAT